MRSMLRFSLLATIVAGALVSSAQADCLSCDCFNSPPTLTGRVKFLYMHRVNNGGGRILRDANTNQTLLRSSDFDFDFEPGVDTSIIYNTASGVGVEGRFVWFDDWTASEFVQNPGSIGVTTNPFTEFFAAAGFTANYSSEFHSGEINLRFPGRRGDIQWIAGFRYIEFNEDLTLLGRGGGANPSNFEFDTRNDLYGFQFGADATLVERGRLSLDGFIKFGVYANNVEAQSRFVLGGAQQNRQIDREHVGAFLTEFGVEAGYQVNDHVRLLAGYQGMILEGVALSSDQVGRTGDLTANSGTFPMNASNQAFYHGISASAEVTW